MRQLTDILGEIGFLSDNNEKNDKGIVTIFIAIKRSCQNIVLQIYKVAARFLLDCS